MAASQTQEESDCSELDFSICSGSEYVPSQISDLSDEDNHSLQSVISPAPSPPASQRDPGRLKEQDTEVDENNNVVFASSDDGCSDSGVTGESPIAATQSDPQGNEEEEKGGGSEMDEDDSSQHFADVNGEFKHLSEM
uniref:uncharacterized protein LOC106675907 isoform X2 n=1 Tax=Maylandia zebra TaxID=106582 RepID=UPI000D307392|nr:uncharacterized protein LOC106675907 isoform X2 [Maylandia zebra]